MCRPNLQWTITYNFIEAIWLLWGDEAIRVDIMRKNKIGSNFALTDSFNKLCVHADKRKKNKNVNNIFKIPNKH